MSEERDVFERFSLEGRVAIVTGASSGIGRRFARVLAGAGARVVAAARRRELLEDLAGREHRIHPFVCDVADETQAIDLVEATFQRFGRLDVLVNAAGIADEGQRAESERLDTFRRVLAVNLEAVFVLCREAARYMIHQGSGSIVNVGSVHGLVAAAPNRLAAYAASKGGLVLLTRELACQWARKGVRVNTLAPGYFQTEMTAGLFATERGRRWVEQNTPMGRPGKLEELDGALLLLCSDAGSFITGSTLVVDGGWTAR